FPTDAAHPDRILRYDGKTGAPLPAPGKSGATFVDTGFAGLNGANGLAFGADGNLYVTSFNSDTVLRYDLATGQPLPAGGQSGAVFIPAGSGGLDGGDELAFGPDGNLYVASLFTGSVLRYGPSGTFLGAFVPAASGGGITPSSLSFLPSTPTPKAVITNVAPT